MIKFIVFIIALYFLLSALNSTETWCVERTEIIEIGGCNRNSCGVRLKNGTITERAAPVIGESICLKHQSNFDFKMIGF